MVFIWRGFGLAVPIIFFLSCWITSYSFEDVTLGNTEYIGWSLLWAGCVLPLFALASFGEKLDDHGQPTGEKPKHDFFWIPIWVWALAFIGVSIYLINIDPSDSNSSSTYSYSDTGDNSGVSVEREDDLEKEVDQRDINLYNCAADSIKIEITETVYVDGTNYNFYVQDNDYEFVTIDPGEYTVKMNDYSEDIDLTESHKSNGNDYDGTWMVLCAEIDLVLVEVTEICEEGITADDLAEFKWMDNVIDRYNGDGLIEPNIKAKRGGKVKVTAPNFYLPQEHEKRENVYALIAIDRADDVTEEFLLRKLEIVAVR